MNRNTGGRATNEAEEQDDSQNPFGRRPSSNAQELGFVCAACRSHIDDWDDNSSDSEGSETVDEDPTQNVEPPSSPAPPPQSGSRQAVTPNTENKAGQPEHAAAQQKEATGRPAKRGQQRSSDSENDEPASKMKRQVYQPSKARLKKAGKPRRKKTRGAYVFPAKYFNELLKEFTKGKRVRKKNTKPPGKAKNSRTGRRN